MVINKITEIFRKVDGIAFANGKLKDGTSWNNYRMKDGLKELKKLLLDNLPKKVYKKINKLFD